MGTICASVGHAWELVGAPKLALRPYSEAPEALRSAFFVEMCAFAILAPLCSEGLTFEGLGA